MGKFVKYNFEATDENVSESIKNNTYYRAESIKSFLEALDMIESNMFISLDARWGQGKSFFVRQAELTLKYLSRKKLGKDVEDLESVFEKSTLKSIALNNTYLPIYYNAWLYDNHDDPLLSLLFIIVKECGKYVSTEFVSSSIIEKLSSLMSAFSVSLGNMNISPDLKKIKGEFLGKNILETIKTAEETREIIKLILDDIINESAQKLIVFVDELDRCKPSYAIELLERIKHYFDDERVIFVASVNKEQLVHTISRYYGTAFDSTGYLNRFFDYNMYLPDIPQYCKNTTFNASDEQFYLRYIVKDLAEYFELSLRDYLKFYNSMESTLKYEFNDFTSEGCMLSIFVPIIKILDMVDQSLKTKFLRGEPDIFDELFNNIPSLNKMVYGFGGNNENDVDAFDKGFAEIRKVYQSIFGKNNNYKGKIQLSADFKNMCIRVCNGC